MSSSIDERIVSIKFNNSQFEAGIRTTMTSLDGLKKGLNFSAAITALGNLDAAGKKVNMKLDSTGFDASVKNVVDSSNRLKAGLKFDGVTKGLNDLDAAGKKVNLKLDAAGFQAGAKAVVDAATTIKQNLNFESAQRGIGNLKSSVQNFSFQSLITGSQNAMKSLGDLDLAGKAVSFLPISEGADRAHTSISAMSVAGIAALAGLAFKAASVGADMAKSLFIDPAKSGLAEYELNLGSIQTILANTQSKGSTLGDVNGALDELNAYSDKTIYNFAEMAKNIGTFTSAGVGLKDSTTAIKGIANLAALSGSNSEQASSAMYQLSQAMSTGSVKLQDWNSVVNAGMGGEVFQNALKETAKNQGTNVDALIAKHGSFRDSLTSGWVTDKVMLETLSKMTGDLTDEQLRAMGYNDEQIKGIQAMAVTASDAATKIKTFSQLTGTLTEITGSGWAQSWKYILGDFEQAKVMWTSIYGVLGDMVQGTADARNKMLREWNEAGGRQEMIWAVGNAFRALMGVLNPVKEAFREVFPPTTGQQLFEITKAIRIFTEALLPNEHVVGLIKNTFKLFFTVIKIGVDIIKGALSVVFAFFKAFATGGDSISGSMKPITDALAAITKSLQESKVVEKFFAALATAATTLGNVLRTMVGFVVNVGLALYNIIAGIVGAISWFGLIEFALDAANGAFRTFGEMIQFVLTYIDNLGVALREGAKAFVNGGITAAIDAFQNSLTAMGDVGEIVLTRIEARLASIRRFADRLARAWDQVMAVLARVWEKMLPLREAVADLFADLSNELKNVFTNVNFNDTLDMVNTGLLAGLVLLFRNTFKKMLGMGDGMKDGLLKSLTDGMDGVQEVLGALTGTLEAMQQNLKADTLMKIAMAIGILAISVVALSLIDSGKLTKALVAIGVMVFILTKAMEALDKISIGSGFLKIPFIAAGMILLAIALAILVIPVTMLAKLSWGELIKGLVGTIALMVGLTKAAESMSANPADLIATGIGLIAVAIAIKILASAVKDISELSFGAMIQGLLGVGALLTALAIFNNMTKVNKGSFASAAGFILLGIALKIMASALGDFAAMDTASLIQGMGVLAIVLALMSRFSNTIKPADIMQSAAAMIILAFAMKIMASAIGDLGSMRWQDLAQGIVVMVVALDAMSKAMARVPPNMLTSAIGFMAVAAAMKILASALQDFGGMSWEEIAKGLTVLAASLLLISVALIAMEGTLTGAAAILIVAVALGILAPVLERFGQMSWEEMLHGFAALAGIFVIFGLAGLLLAPIVPILFLLGVAMGMLGIGLFGVGMGTVLFAAGMVAMATAVIIAGPILVAFIASLLALIPLAMVEFGKGIVAFADVIGGAMPTFLNAFVALLTTLLTAVNIVFPQIMATLWMVIVGLVSLVVRAIPLFVDAGMKIIIGIWTGIGNNMGKLVDAAVKVVTEFIDGIARNIGKIIESGVNLIVKFVEGLAQSVRNNSDRMNNAGLDLAKAIIDGMVNGIAKGVGRVIEGAKNMANDALNAAKNLLGIKSPSREFFAIGKFVDMGFANGVDKYAHLGVNSIEGMGTTAMGVLKKTMANIGTAAEVVMDMSPTIRPVLDLSAIKRDSGLVAGMLGVPSLAVDGTYNKAATLAVQARANRDTQVAVPEGAVTPSTGDTITFIQNNSSPKALSRGEIYRQTKNQLSVVKK